MIDVLRWCVQGALEALEAAWDNPHARMAMAGITAALTAALIAALGITYGR